jgi:putative transposase
MDGDQATQSKIRLRPDQQISHAFGIQVHKDVVRRVLAKHYSPGDSGTNGPSWLTFLAQTKDSLLSLGLFRCESVLLQSHWVLPTDRLWC